MSELRKSIVGTLGEFLQELECASDNIAQLSLQHIHSHDAVLTCGYSSTVARFFRVNSFAEL